MRNAITKAPTASHCGTDRTDRGRDHSDHQPAGPVEPARASKVRLLRAAEVQCILCIGRSKTYEMMATGELPTVRIGRAVRVPLPALEQWIADHASGDETGHQT